MRFMSTRAHGMMDSVLGPVLVALPFVLALDVSKPQGWTLLLLGIALLLLACFTDYETGLVPRISVGAHLTVDAAAGALLAVSPWLFGFSNRIWVPHVVIGLFELGSAFVTRREPTVTRERSVVSRA